jgi:hypothetical protein
MWEGWRRRRKRKFPAVRRRAGNISFWLFNTTAAALVFTPPDQIRAPWPLSPTASLVAGFLLLDLMIYAVHRTYHAVPALWRLHALHHSDPDVDWSTAVRHHPLEYLSAGAVYWLAILALGIPGPVVAFHGACVFVLAVATHGNVRWPAWLERGLAPIVITLYAHLEHHSIEVADVNFGAVLSVWDRLFGTYRRPSHEPVFGVRELTPCDACKPTEMLLTPFRIGQMYTNTYSLPDGREIEVSAERRRRTLRLRARLVEAGRVQEIHMGDFELAGPDCMGLAVATFTQEFEELTGLEALRLFPDKLL